MFVHADRPLELQAHQTLLEGRRHLQILRAQLTDTAFYTCIAINEAGRTQQTFQLEMLGQSLTCRLDVGVDARNRRSNYNY